LNALPRRFVQVQMGLSVIRHKCIEVNQLRDPVPRAVGHAGCDHAAVAVADQYDVPQVFISDDVEDVLNVRFEIDRRVSQMLALAGGFVTGLAGFGTALMALGIWLYVLPPSTAVPLALICSIVAQTSTLPSFWRSFDLKLVWPFLIGGLAGVPLGTMLVADADP